MMTMTIPAMASMKRKSAIAFLPILAPRLFDRGPIAHQAIGENEYAARPDPQVNKGEENSEGDYADQNSDEKRVVFAEAEIGRSVCARA